MVLFRFSNLGPVNNVLVIRQPLALYPRTTANNQASMVRRHVPLPPPLEKYTSIDKHSDFNAFITLQPNCDRLYDATYTTVHSMDNQINELQQHGSSGASEMEVERLKLD
ncbi:hypothetical protein L6452_18101 [Arctium lappa]|uniref:Uncharacterized protein n=1 Tax=Arctium lappa TaxID=4217 RepID=A0ACB9C589_ARCLA|nr:hypothetical protein L6452_18101 [Arctium lappa]